MAREHITIDSNMPSSGSIGRFFGGAAQQVGEYVQASFPGVAQNVQQTAEALTGILEPAQQLVDSARSLMTDPLRYLSEAAAKAIPAAIAASASLQYTGGQGSFSNFLQPISLRTKFFRVNGNRNSFIGGALYATRALNTLTGYCKCSDVKLNLPGNAQESAATLDEQQIVVRYLESGVYIE